MLMLQETTQSITLNKTRKMFKISIPMIHHLLVRRIRTAFAWAPRPSHSASVTTVGPKFIRPSREISCEVICFWNE